MDGEEETREREEHSEGGEEWNEGGGEEDEVERAEEVFEDFDDEVVGISFVLPDWSSYTVWMNWTPLSSPVPSALFSLTSTPFARAASFSCRSLSCTTHSTHVSHQV